MLPQLYTNCAVDATFVVAGIMSGTSMDGIDVALVEIAGSGLRSKIRLLAFACYPYPADVQNRLLRLAEGEAVPANEISDLDFILGRIYANAVIKCADEFGIAMDSLDLVCSHGQTVYHNGTASEAALASTLQIGQAAIIAELTGLAVVSDFRTADIAAGGQGAPLVPYFDFVFLRDSRVTRAAQNIGGIANVTFIPADCEIDDVIAFDTGPGNMLTDAAVRLFSNGKRAYDINGEMAKSGRVAPALLSRLLNHPFYAQKPPKSAGREQFGEHYLTEILSWPEASGLAPEDVVATLTALTAETIAAAYRNYLPGAADEIVLSGGGANNPVLVDMIKQAVGSKVIRFDDFGIPNDAKEAVAFALLGSETIRGVASNVPSATGATHPVVLGKITPGRRSPFARCALLP